MTDDEVSEDAARPRPAALTFTRPGSINTLKKEYNFKLRMPDAAQFMSELLGESDRAAVILASSQLDDLLANAIALRMGESMDIMALDIEKIFRPSGPLGSFSARAEVANLFGIIENETYEQLTILREMRNACAHSKHPITFNDPLLRNVARNLFAPRGSTSLAFAEREMKKAFALEIAQLVLVLGLGSRAAATAERNAATREFLDEHTTLHDKPPQP